MLVREEMAERIDLVAFRSCQFFEFIVRERTVRCRGMGNSGRREGDNDLPDIDVAIPPS